MCVCVVCVVCVDEAVVLVYRPNMLVVFTPAYACCLLMHTRAHTQNGTDANGTDDWSVDTSQEAVKARMENLSNQASALTLHDDLEKTSGERVNLFYKFVEVRGIVGTAFQKTEHVCMS